MRFYEDLVNKVRSIIYFRKDAPAPDLKLLDFVKSRQGILKELMVSKESGYLIGVYCKLFGEGMFLTAVENISTTKGVEIIEFTPYDLGGEMLPATRIELNDIKMVCPFNKPYKN